MKYCQQNLDTLVINELTLHEVYAHVSTAQGVRSDVECSCTKLMHVRYFCLFLSIISSNWLSMCLVYALRLFLKFARKHGCTVFAFSSVFFVGRNPNIP